MEVIVIRNVVALGLVNQIQPPKSPSTFIHFFKKFIKYTSNAEDMPGAALDLGLQGQIKS